MSAWAQTASSCRAGLAQGGRLGPERVAGLTRIHMPERSSVGWAFWSKIAAHALSLRVALATNNVGEFQQVAGLNVERWA